MRRKIEQATMRRELKAMGYKVAVRAGSLFSTGKVTKDGDQVSGVNAMSPEFYEKHKAFFDWKASVEIVDDGGWRTIL